MTTKLINPVDMTFTVSEINEGFIIENKCNEPRDEFGYLLGRQTTEAERGRGHVNRQQPLLPSPLSSSFLFYSHLILNPTSLPSAGLIINNEGALHRHPSLITGPLRPSAKSTRSQGQLLPKSPREAIFL